MPTPPRQSSDVNPWWDILAPAGTPAPLIRQINEDVADTLKSKEVLNLFEAQGATPLVTTPDTFRSLLESDIEKWAAVVKASGARLG